MATYTLIPSSWDQPDYVTNPTNAYTDTSSNSYAEAVCGEGTGPHLGGFNFSTIPSSEIVDSIDVKVKAYCSDESLRATVYSSPSGVALSNTITLGTSYAQVYTFTLTASIGTILANKSTLCIRFVSDSFLESAYVYGAEVNITTVTQKTVNKIIYGGNTLIDLTGDTATASDVAVGKTFHLASGLQATGTLSPSVATATTSSSTARTVSFTVSKEPSWFMMICASTNTTARSYRVQHLLYDGTTTTMYYGNGSTAGSINTSTSHVTFSYSSGTLTISVDSSGPYLGAADWALYYL